MEEDPLIPKAIGRKNVIESVSGICNVYQKASTSVMYAGARHAQFVADHGTSLPQQDMSCASNNKDQMKDKFVTWGIHLKWVILFPHVDDFNGRDPGQNFLGCVSQTVVASTNPPLGPKFVTKHRQTMTFCQWKVHEDT